MANSLEVVLTPALLPLYDANGKVVVVIDILRATTSMCVAFETGVTKILPVSSPEECKLFRDFDFLCAAERNASKVDGFDLGNSPFEYQNPILNGRSVAFTTTNGTKAIKMAKSQSASQIVIGSFLNLNAVAKHIVQSGKSVILLCAGWKDKFNLEDTLYAGALVNQVKDKFNIDCDSSIAAEQLFNHYEDDLESIVRLTSHAKRFKDLHGDKDDVSYSLQMNTLNIVPIMNGEYIVCPAKVTV